MLLVDDVTKQYGDLRALDNVGFSVERGQIVGFLGPNGAGKTTTMRAIMGLVSLDSGEVTWDGHGVGRAVRRRFGYMPAERGMYQRMRVRDHLVYYARLSGHSHDAAGQLADRWLDKLDLTSRADDPVQSLSSGNQQRVQLGLALLAEPELLVLDEPFSGLDPVAVETLSGVLREQVAQGVALLLSSHQLDLVAEICSAVVIVDQGQVVLRGDVAQLRAASTIRYVEAEFAVPTAWPGPQHAAVSSVDDGRRHRVALGVDDDAEQVLADARRHGDLVSYSVAPPSLSEVFLGAVGRDTIDTGSSGPVAGDTDTDTDSNDSSEGTAATERARAEREANT